jgi:PAS domain S-box-containing protein
MTSSRVLVVDDDLVFGRVLAAVLTDLGCQFQSVQTGKAALAIAKTESFDLVLLDIGLPDIDGYEVCQTLKVHPKTQHWPVIFISSYDQVFDKVRAFNLGGIDYLSKPLQYQEMSVRLKVHVNNLQLTRALETRERELRSQKNFLQQVLKATPSAIFAKDIEGRFLLANEVAASIHGVNADALMGHYENDFNPNVNLEPFFALNQEVMASGQSKTVMNETMLTYDGQLKYLQTTIVPLSNEQGQVQGVIGSWVDITERKQAEMALMESEAKYRQLVENADDVIYIHTLEGVFTYLSPKCFDVLGYQSEELIGRAIDELVAAEDLAAVKFFLYRILVTQKSNHGLEFRSVRPDQSTVWLTANIAPIKDEHNLLIGFQGIMRDISYRKQAEDSLKVLAESTASTSGIDFFATCVKSLAHILQTDYVFIGEFSPTEPVVMKSLAFGTLTHLMTNFECSGHQMPLESVRQGQVCHYIQSVRKYFPECTFLSDYEIESFWGLPLVSSKGSVLGMIGVLHSHHLLVTTEQAQMMKIFVARASAELERQMTDMKLRKAKNAAEVANEAKSRFLANMSHELKTPLNGILGFAQLMARDPLVTLEQQQHLKAILRSGQHLLTLINNILDRSKFEAGKITLDLAPCSLYELVLTVESILRWQADSKGIRLEVDYCPDLPLKVMVDSGKLRQVLINLMSNAIKFTAQGQVSLRVTPQEACLQECPGRLLGVNFAVVDTGVGIAAEELSQIFDPFFQSSSNQTFVEGSGLGLTICQQFVELMGGTLTVTSQLGQGSKFEFTVALEPCPLPNQRHPASYEQPIDQGIALANDPTRADCYGELRQALAALSLDWIEQLTEAALLGYEDQVIDLVKQLPSEQAPLAHVLTQQAQQYEFAEILQLVQAVTSG